jgi:hypothetical protein
MGVHESRIQQALTELDISVSMFALLAGINRTRIGQCLQGLHEFTGPETLKLSALIEELRSIVRDVAPVPVNFRDDCAAIQKLLEHRRQQIRWAATAIESPEGQNYQRGQ